MQKVALKEKTNGPYDLNESIINFYKHIKKCLKLAKEADWIKFTAGQILQQVLHYLQVMGTYMYKVKERKMKAITDKTWNVFKYLFAYAYHHLLEEKIMNTR